MKDDINVCFLWGTMISPVQFEFFYNSKRHISEATCWIETLKGNTEIKIKGYDDMADKLYKNFKIGDTLSIVGYLENNMVIVENLNEELNEKL